jgi:hypothetical protein
MKQPYFALFPVMKSQRICDGVPDESIGMKDFMKAV